MIKINTILIPKSPEEVEASFQELDATQMLRAAASFGRLDYLKQALEAGAKINECDDEAGEYPIELAIDNSHFEIVYYLLNQGAGMTNISLVGAFDNETLFIFLLDHIEKYEPDMLTEKNLNLAIEIAREDQRYDRLEMIRARIKNIND